MRKKKHEREEEKGRMKVEESESDTKWRVSRLRDMTYAYVTCLIHMCDMTHSCV